MTIRRRQQDDGYASLTLALSDRAIYGLRAIHTATGEILIAVAGAHLWLVSVQRDPFRADVVASWTPRVAPTSDLAFDPVALSARVLEKRPPCSADSEEYFYSADFTVIGDDDSAPHLGKPGDLLCIAGGLGCGLRIVNVHTRRAIASATGVSIGDINEVKTHPRIWHWIGFAGKDCAVQIYDLRAKAVLVAMGGMHGHKQQVLSFDWHPTQPHLVSSGADHAVHEWDLPPDETLLDLAHAIANGTSTFLHIHAFARQSQWPHPGFVDCVQYLATTDSGPRSIVSKSSDGELHIWQFPLPEDSASSPSLWVVDVQERGPRPHWLATARYPPHVMWFFKFSITTTACAHVAALGLADGQIAVWDLSRLMAQCAADRATALALPPFVVDDNVEDLDPSDLYQVCQSVVVPSVSWEAALKDPTVLVALAPTKRVAAAAAGQLTSAARTGKRGGEGGGASRKSARTTEARSDPPIRMAIVECFEDDLEEGTGDWIAVGCDEDGDLVVHWLGSLSSIAP